MATPLYAIALLLTLTPASAQNRDITQCMLRDKVVSDARHFVDKVVAKHRSETGGDVALETREFLTNAIVERIARSYRLVESPENCPPGMTMYDPQKK